MNEAGHDDDLNEEGRRALQALLDSFARQAEHRLVSRTQQLRELFQYMLEAEDPRYDEWLREALRVLDESKPENS